MRTRKPAQTRKGEIVAATLKLADSLGPDGFTTAAIAEKVGLTQPAIFRHFPSKQKIWEAVADHIGTLMEERWRKALAGDLSPTQQLRLLVAAQLRLIQSTPAIPAILFSRELHAKNKGLRQAFFALLTRFHRVVAGLVGAAIAKGELRGDVEPDDAALLVIGLVQGLAVRWSISGRNFDLVEEGGRLLELQLDGFSSQSHRASK